MRIDAAALVAEVCRDFGWTVDHVLRMPARRFFKMLEASRQLRAEERMELCNIQAISIADVEYLKELKGAYLAQYRRPEEIEESVAVLDGESARSALVGLFG